MFNFISQIFLSYSPMHFLLSFVVLCNLCCRFVDGQAHPNHVCMYRGYNYDGDHNCFRTETTGNLCEEQHGGCTGPWNDKVRSIRLGSNVPFIELFASAEFTGSLGNVTTSEPHLPGHQHGFTSFRVGGGTPVSAPHGQVCLFKERYFHGSRICFDNGATGNLCADEHGGCTGPWNDKIRSILFGAGVLSLELFDNADFSGPLGNLTASEPNLSGPQHLFTTFWVGGPAPDNQVCFYLRHDFLGPR